MAKERVTLAERFWSKVLKTDTCWFWQAQVNNKGYGVFTYYTVRTPTRPSKGLYAHRVSWMLTHGDIPEGLRVLHRCDNPPCCNPKHLFLGTQKENMVDCAKKGRASKGGDNAKVTPEQVRLIRADTRKHHVIAADYGMRRLAIWNIKKRRTWANVPD
jgi:hypothetical protein